MKARWALILLAAIVAFLATRLCRRSIASLEYQGRRHDALVLRLSSLEEQARLTSLASGRPVARRAAPESRSSVAAQDFSQVEEQAFSLAMNHRSRRTLARAVAELELYLRPKFAALGLSDEEWDRFEVLAAQRTLAAQAEAERPGHSSSPLDTRTAASISDATASLEDQMRTVVGDQAFSKLNESFTNLDRPQSTPAEGSWRQDFSNLLLFSDSPLTQDQATALKNLRPRLDQAAAVKNILGGDQFQVWMNIQQQAELQKGYK